MSIIETTVRDKICDLRHLGNTYLVCMRDDEGNLIWRCTLCQKDFKAFTYVQTAAEIQGHLTYDQGHIKMLEFADKTLHKNNPWPFYDSVVFSIHTPDVQKVENVICFGELDDMKIDFIGVSTKYQRLTDNNAFVQKLWFKWSACEAIPLDMQNVPRHQYSLDNFKFRQNLGRRVTLGEQMERMRLSDKPKKELKLKEVIFERTCHLCCSKILPASDVGTFLHNASSRLSCSFFNDTGNFHVFHMSCIIQWTLLMDGVSLNGPNVEVTQIKGYLGKAVEATPQNMAKIDGYLHCPECCSKDSDPNFLNLETGPT
ncbi:uncharacterized protein LOC132644936 isoform X2 [Lycium barbarum]|uniref:uncharacterized protein LOC132644936 isoform X2 n=1 Tax=Lycium barbarum TaxID=112863 RepID=UPI00293E088C|nr:uncharacterized protein LOC132644936 isoform X2 [Lycium barbarum]